MIDFSGVCGRVLQTNRISVISLAISGIYFVHRQDLFLSFRVLSYCLTINSCFESRFLLVSMLFDSYLVILH